MKIRRPEFLKLLRAVSVAVVTDSGDIVGERVQPHINHMFRIEIHGNSPFKGSSGHTEILKSRKQEIVHHLVLAGFRLDEFRMILDILDQAVRIFAHLKEIRLLLCGNAGASAIRTLTVHKLGFCKEGLTGSTVHSLVMPLVDIPLGVHFFEDLLHLFLMVLICGADELIIRSIHKIPDIFDLTGYLIHKFLGCYSRFLRLQLDLLTMLVRSCLEKHIVSLQSLVTGDRVRQDNLVGISDMRLAGCIGNGRSNIILLLFHIDFLLHFIEIKNVLSNSNEKTSPARVTTSFRFRLAAGSLNGYEFSAGRYGVRIFPADTLPL